MTFNYRRSLIQDAAGQMNNREDAWWLDTDTNEHLEMAAVRLERAAALLRRAMREPDEDKS